MTCYGVLGQAILFHVVNVCKLSSTKPYLHSIHGLLVLTIYIPDPCIPGFFSDIELCFDMFLSLFESLLGTVCSNFSIMFKLKKKRIMTIQELT